MLLVVIKAFLRGFVAGDEFGAIEALGKRAIREVQRTYFAGVALHVFLAEAASVESSFRMGGGDVEAKIALASWDVGAKMVRERIIREREGEDADIECGEEIDENTLGKMRGVTTTAA